MLPSEAACSTQRCTRQHAPVLLSAHLLNHHFVNKLGVGCHAVLPALPAKHRLLLAGLLAIVAAAAAAAAARAAATAASAATACCCNPLRLKPPAAGSRSNVANRLPLKACRQTGVPAGGGSGGGGGAERIVPPTWSTSLQTAASAAGAAGKGRPRARPLAAGAERRGRLGSAPQARHGLVRSSIASVACERLLPPLLQVGCWSGRLFRQRQVQGKELNLVCTEQVSVWLFAATMRRWPAAAAALSARRLYQSGGGNISLLVSIGAPRRQGFCCLRVHKAPSAAWALKACGTPVKRRFDGSRLLCGTERPPYCALFQALLRSAPWLSRRRMPF